MTGNSLQLTSVRWNCSAIFLTLLAKMWDDSSDTAKMPAKTAAWWSLLDPRFGKFMTKKRGPLNGHRTIGEWMDDPTGGPVIRVIFDEVGMMMMQSRRCTPCHCVAYPVSVKVSLPRNLSIESF